MSTYLLVYYTNYAHVNAEVISLNMGSMFYYLAYVCGKPQSVAVVGMILSMPMHFLIPLSKPVIAKTGMKNGLIGGFLLMTLGRVVVGLGGSTSLMAVYIGSVIFAVGCSTQWCSYPLLCNTVEYGEWQNGYRQEGLIMSVNSFGSKCGTALGTAFCGWILAWAGYNGCSRGTDCIGFNRYYDCICSASNCLKYSVCNYS